MGYSSFTAGETNEMLLNLVNKVSMILSAVETATWADFATFIQSCRSNSPIGKDMFLNVFAVSDKSGAQLNSSGI